MLNMMLYKSYTNPIQILYKSKSMPIQVQVDANPCCLLGIAFTIPFQILVVSLMFQYLIFRIFEYKLEHFSPHSFAFIEPNCGDFEPVCNPNTYNYPICSLLSNQTVGILSQFATHPFGHAS